jgi:hypothetical protein
VSTGKLYFSVSDQFIANVSYQLQHHEDHHWWGELTLVEYKQVKDGGGYIIELEDGKKCHCSLKKRVNRAVTSLPPRYVYHVSGSGDFD